MENASGFSVATTHIDIGEFLTAYLKAQKNASSWLKHTILSSPRRTDQIGIVVSRRAIMNSSRDGFPIKQADAPVPEAPINHLSGPPSQAAIPVPRVFVTCSSCAATLSVKRSYVGAEIQCKQCGHILTVPTEVSCQTVQVVGQPASGMPNQPRQTDPDTGSLRTGLVDKAILDQLAQIITGSNEIRLSHDRLQDEHNELLADRDGLVARLKSVTELLDAMRADLGTIAPAEVRSIASERDDLRARAQRLHDENRHLTQRLEQTDALLHAARNERDQQSEQLALSRSELAAAKAELDRSSHERQAAKLFCEELERQNDKLVMAQARRESEHEALVLAERTEREQLASEVFALRANAEETARVAEQLISASLIPRDEPHPAAFELETVRRQAQELKSKLDEANFLYRLMAETLDGSGIQIADSLQDDRAFDCLEESITDGFEPSDLEHSAVRSESRSLQ
jgi:uncharacterized coiled-coil DUF342 family protein